LISPKNRNMRIVITGVAGFIGSNLAEKLLLQGEGHYKTFELIGIDNLSYGREEQIPDQVQFHRLDVRSPEIYPLFERGDYIFHLAAKNCIADCQANPVETADINVTGTVNVLEAARKAGAYKVIYAESSALYEGSRLFPTPETEIAPLSFYASSKQASISFVKSYQRFSNLKITALRYFNVYGPGQDYRRSIPPVMSAFIISLLKGERPVIFGDGDKKRDFVHVDDVNDFHMICLENRETDGKCFNLGRGENFSVIEIYRLISEKIGIKINPLFKPDLPGEARITLADIGKARRMGWNPKTGLEKGLDNMIAYLKTEMEKGNIS
jgi:UDP-glucose 4-epimerase